MTDQPPFSDAPTLEEVRARIDAVDAALLRLIDERAALAQAVAAAKRAGEAPRVGAGREVGEAAPFGLRPAREAQVMRALLARPRTAASAALVVRIWRELMGESLAAQGPFRLVAWGGRDPARTAELARLRFGAAAPLTLVAKPEEALKAARERGTVAVLPLDPGSPWWGRLLAEPTLTVFAVAPCLRAWGGPAALAVAAVEVEPSGGDLTLWVTDAAGSAEAVEAALGACGVVGDLLAEAGGLKLFALAGYLQPDDPRLADAPGTLRGVIGAAPPAFDL